MTPKFIQRQTTTPKWVERQIDEALLLVATQAAFLYVHRRGRRVLPKVVLGTAVVGGVGAAAAAAATVAAGIGALGLTGGAVVWYRRRSNSAAAVAPAHATDWRPTSGATPSARVVGSNAGDSPAKDAQPESSTNT
jgi:hypothetical protein